MTTLENKDQYVHEVFNLIADNYDEMNNIMTWGMLKGKNTADLWRQRLGCLLWHW